MARSFGDDEDKKGDKQKPAANVEGAAWNGCSNVDEGDSTQTATNGILQYQAEDIREDAAEGQHLYLDFVRTEMLRNGLEVELPCMDRNNDEIVAATADFADPQRLMDWTRAGRELRQLADAFSRSKERQSVQKRAQNLSLDSLEFDNFLQLLQELFQLMYRCYQVATQCMFFQMQMYLNLYVALCILLGGGITRERILVLFFFCADVAIEALRRGFHQTFHRLLGWSLQYISTSVAQYVHSVGGWGVVLRQSLDIAYHFTACCAFVAVVAACVVYIRRNFR